MCMEKVSFHSHQLLSNPFTHAVSAHQHARKHCPVILLTPIYIHYIINSCTVYQIEAFTDHATEKTDKVII